MKAIVEWGTPKAATESQICGISGHFVAANPTRARQLANQLVHTMTQGKESASAKQGILDVSKAEPRKVFWASDNTAWVAVSVLDGVPRGAYAGIADREYRERIKAVNQNEETK